MLNGDSHYYNNKNTINDYLFQSVDFHYFNSNYNFTNLGLKLSYIFFKQNLFSY